MFSAYRQIGVYTGSILKGAQGNLPLQRAVAYRWRANAAAAADRQQHLLQRDTIGAT